MAIVEKWLQKSFISSVPLQASLELTHQCNLRCSHCYIENYEDDRVLTLDQWQNILIQLREAGTLYLVLMGGEPTLSGQLVPIVKLASKMGFYSSIITNGIELSKPGRLEELKEAGTNSITFSLYSMDGTLHERMIQREGVHQKLLETILRAKKLLPNISINSLLTKDSIGKALDVAYWCEEYQLQFNFDPQPTGDRVSSASKEQLTLFYSQLVAIWPEARPSPRDIDHDLPICNIARGKCAIDPTGNLLGCIEMRTILGNLLEKPFKDIWQNETAVGLRNYYNREMKDDSSFCSHCPAMAIEEKRTPYKITAKNSEISEIRRALWK